MFQFQNAASPVFQMKDLNVSPLDVSTDTAKFDLMLAAREEDDALVCVMEYSTELFAGATIERILKQFSNLLAAIAAQPDERVSRLPLMTEAEQRQIVHEWNDTVAEFPREQGIHELFEEQVALTPDAMALIAGSEHITFRELNQRANQLARYLRRQHVGPEVRVAICVERSIDMIVGLLGIMKAGGVYVPLEPNCPPERLSFIVEDSQAALILTHQHLRASLSGAPIVCFDEIRAELPAESTADVASGVTPTNAAHVIYTSGSTGQPKGAISSHSASVNRFAWMWHHYPFGPNEVCCQKTALSFVDSIWEIFGPLLQGVRLVIIPDEVVKDPAQF